MSGSCTGCGKSIGDIHQCNVTPVPGHCKHYLDLTPARCGECAIERDRAELAVLRERDRTARVLLEEPLERWPHRPGDRQRWVTAVRVFLGAAPTSEELSDIPERLRKLDLLRSRYFREDLHMNYNGGHQDATAREAFHHGMDTVCNVLVDLLAPPPPEEKTDG